MPRSSWWYRARGGMLASAFLFAGLASADDPPPKAEAVRIPVVRTIEVGSKVFDVQLSKDGKMLAIGSEREVGILHELEQLEAVELKGHGKPVRRVAMFSDKSLVATGGDDGTVRLWKLPDAKPIGVLKGHSGPITALRFSPDGRILVSGDSGGDLLFHEVDAPSAPTGKVERLGNGITQLAFAPNGKYVAVSLTTGQVGFLEPEAPYRIILGPARHSSAIRGLVVSNDSTAVVAADEDGVVQLYDPKTGKGVKEFKVDAGAASLSFSPSGAFLAVGGWDKGRLYIVDWATLRVVAQWDGHGSTNAQYGLAFSTDGSRLYSGSGDGTVKVWKLDVLQESKK
jgi:WD40 repeat protein